MTFFTDSHPFSSWLRVENFWTNEFRTYAIPFFACTLNPLSRDGKIHGSVTQGRPSELYDLTGSLERERERETVRETERDGVKEQGEMCSFSTWLEILSVLFGQIYFMFSCGGNSELNIKVEADEIVQWLTDRMTDGRTDGWTAWGTDWRNKGMTDWRQFLLATSRHCAMSLAVAV